MQLQGLADMKILIIKMTSLGDIIHSFPALTDAGKAIKDIRFDWVVDKAFMEIPSWHPLVDKVIPISTRKWKKAPLEALKSGAITQAIKHIRNEQYDMVIDAQGLIKSKILCLLAKGKRAGYDKHSAREGALSFIYQQKCSVPKKEHAIERTRALFAQSLGYPKPSTKLDYHISHRHENNGDYLVFLPNTTWDTKHYPEKYWHELIQLADEMNYQVQIPWGAPHEQQRAQRLAKGHVNAHVLERMSLNDLALILSKAKGVIAIDTGLAHIAAAIGVPNVAIFGPTNPKLSGVIGANQLSLENSMDCAPCMKRQCQLPDTKSYAPPCFDLSPPKKIWDALQNLLKP